MRNPIIGKSIVLTVVQFSWRQSANDQLRQSEAPNKRDIAVSDVLTKRHRRHPRRKSTSSVSFAPRADFFCTTATSQYGAPLSKTSTE